MLLIKTLTKGIFAKIEDGIYPSIAPVGYYNTMNRKGKHIVAVDEKKKAVIKLFLASFEVTSSNTDNLLFRLISCLRIKLTNMV